VIGHLQPDTLVSMNASPAPKIRDLYPNLSEKELAAAEDNLDRYLTLVLRIFERMELETSPQGGPLTNPRLFRYH
jgi:hypothetical protein